MVMSPKMHPVQDIDVEVGQRARGSSDLVPTHDPRLDLAQAQHENMADTPEKAQLRGQVSELVDALQYEETNAHHEIHEVKVDACNKFKALLTDQRESFERAASQYEQHAKDICHKEVAETRADIHGQAISAINGPT